MVIQILILFILLGIMPLLTGGLFVRADEEDWSLPLRWVSGQFFLWAGFQILCVPLVLAAPDDSFSYVCGLYGGFMAAAAFFAAGVDIRRKKRGRTGAAGKRIKGNKSGIPTIFWILFLALLLFQLVQAVRMTYGDGDDAFYVAVAANTAESGAMYSTEPYTGAHTLLNVRYGLAPFPVWIAFLSRVSGIPAVSVAHLALPVTLITMTYAVFYFIGGKLLPKGDERLPMFLVFTEILVLFGDYSIYTPENFMIARSRQGKAALCSIVIPFVIYLLLVWVQSLQNGRKISFSHYALLTAAMFAGCLCSTLGAVLVIMLVGVAGVTAAVCYRKKYVILPLAVCCIPCVCYGCLYLALS